MLIKSIVDSFTNSAYILAVIFYGFLTVIGLSYLVCGLDDKKMYKKFSVYAKRLTGSGTTTPEELASVMNMLEDHVRVDVEQMIRKGFIQYTARGETEGTYTAYIGNVGIQMTGEIPKTDQEISAEKKKQKKEQKQHTEEKHEDRAKPAIVHETPQKQTIVSVTCQSCGGITRIPEKSTSVCDYCGSKIKSQSADR